MDFIEAGKYFTLAYKNLSSLTFFTIMKLLLPLQ